MQFSATTCELDSSKALTVHTSVLSNRVSKAPSDNHGAEYPMINAVASLRGSFQPKGMR